MTQLDMFSVATSPPGRKYGHKRPTIAARFETFCERNPHVLTEMLRLARARLERDEKRIGAKALWEELRASIRIMRHDLGMAGDWKLDNSLTALYARRLIDLEPRLAGVIELRRRKAP